MPATNWVSGFLVTLDLVFLFLMSSELNMSVLHLYSCLYVCSVWIKSVSN